MNGDTEMDCDQCSDLLVPYLTERLSPGRLEEVRAHLETCPTCRRALGDTQWVRDEMLECRAEIDDGHLSARLLYEYVESPASLEAEDIELVRSHLDQCAQCREDHQHIVELAALPASAEPASRTEPGRADRLWQRIVGRFPRPVAPVAAAAAVVVLVVSVYVWQTRSSPAMQWIRTDVVGVTAIELPVRHITRGAPPPPPEPVPQLDRTSGRDVLLAVNLGFLDQLGAYYEVVVREPSGDVVWRDRIPDVYLSAGRGVIRVNPGKLQPGTYRVEVVENESDGFSTVIAEAVFRINSGNHGE